MERKTFRTIRLPGDRIFFGMAVGFLSGLFTGAAAGMALALFLRTIPEVPLGISAYALEGAVMGILIGLLIAIESYGIRNTKSTRWYWALIAATAAGFAVILAKQYSSLFPMALVVLPVIGAASAWIVEHNLLFFAHSRKNPKQEAGPKSLFVLYLAGFAACTALVFIAIWLHWMAIGIIA
jgi:hypothetical protein